MSRSMTFTIEGEVNTLVTITELADGTLRFDLKITGDVIGDLRAIFFDMKDYDAGDSLYILNTDDHQDTTDFDADEGSVDTLGRDANLKGSVTNELGDFDVGVEFGTSGMSRDDIQETSFVLGDVDGALTLEMFDFTDFGVRYTSVGEDGGSRTDSAKIGDQSGHVAANDVITVAENDVATINLLDNDSAGATSTVTAASDAEGTFAEVTGGFERTVSVDGRVLGRLTVASDGATSFEANGEGADTLAVGESAQFSFTYTTTNSDGSQATAKVTVTVTGVNDAPVISIDADDSATGDVIEGDLGLTVSGALTLSDADVSDVVSVSVLSVNVAGATSDEETPSNADILAMLSVPAGPVLDGTEAQERFFWAFDSTSEAFDYLDAGETLELTYTRRATDAQGATDDQTVFITIAGTNDAPIAVDDAGALPEDGIAMFDVLANDRDDEGDDLAVTIIDEGDGQFTGPKPKGPQPSSIITVGANGDITVDSNGAFDALALGQTHDQVIRYQVDDGDGGTAEANLTVGP